MSDQNGRKIQDGSQSLTDASRPQWIEKLILAHREASIKCADANRSVVVGEDYRLATDVALKQTEDDLAQALLVPAPEEDFLSVRDEFAKTALSTMPIDDGSGYSDADWERKTPQHHATRRAKMAYLEADAMMKARGGSHVR